MKKRSVAKRHAKYKTTKKIHQKGGMPNLLLGKISSVSSEKIYYGVRKRG